MSSSATQINTNTQRGRGEESRGEEGNFFLELLSGTMSWNARIAQRGSKGPCWVGLWGTLKHSQIPQLTNSLRIGVPRRPPARLLCSHPAPRCTGAARRGASGLASDSAPLLSRKAARRPAAVLLARAPSHVERRSRRQTRERERQGQLPSSA